MITLTLAMDREVGTGTAAIKEGDAGAIFDFTFEQDAIAEAATEAATLALDKLTATLADPPDGRSVASRPVTSTTPAKPAPKKADATKPKGKSAIADDGFAQVDMFTIPSSSPAPAAAPAAPSTAAEDPFAIPF